MTAFVGPNGSGKTTILRSLDLLLGNAWPSLARIAIPQDFTRFDGGRPLSIEAHFDQPLQVEKDALGKSPEVASVALTVSAYKRRTKNADVGDMHLALEPHDSKGEVPLGRSQRRKGR